MWLNERRRGRGWSASSRPASCAASSSSSLRNARPRRPRVRRLPRGKMPLLGPSWGWGPRRPAARPWRLRGSGSGCPAARLPPPRRPGAHQLRRSRTPGAAPSDRTIRARPRGRRRRRAFEVRGLPAGSPRRGATLVAPALREGASRLRLWPLAEDPGASNSSARGRSGDGLFSGSVHAGLFLLPFLLLLFFILPPLLNGVGDTGSQRSLTPFCKKL